MKRIYHSILLLILVFIYGNTNAQLTITPVSNLQQAIQNSLLGAGVVVNNITYTGDSVSIAEFSGTTSIGISNGLFLGTGNANSLTNNLANFFASSATSAVGDTDLQNLIGGYPCGGPQTPCTYDAAILEFDFQVQGDSVKFNFVFASEEYNEFVNSPYNDVFAFFISGPGITGNQNIALIPGTSNIVSINNVNNGYSPGVSSGPCTNCAYYHDNFMDNTIVFDGFTTVLTAVSAVQPCTVYHIKLAVADVFDQVFDSGVFLEANSFTPCGPLSIFNGLAPIGDTLSFCNGSSVTLSTSIAPGYLWNTGDTTQSITVNQPGNYSVSINSGACFASSYQVTLVTDTAFVKPLISQNGSVLNSSITNPNYTYEWYKDGVAVTNSNNPALTLNTGGCYKVMITDLNGCTDISDSLCLIFAGIENSQQQPFSVSVSPNPVSGNATVSFSNGNHDHFEVLIFDVTGKKILEILTTADQVHLMKNSLKPGIYILQLENVYTKVQARTRFVVE